MAYPHVYGATRGYVVCLYALRGLSPCVWGHLLLPYHLTGKIGSIPMCMGPPGSYPERYLHVRVYPHVYGATGNRPSGRRAREGLWPGVWANRAKGEKDNHA